MQFFVLFYFLSRIHLSSPHNTVCVDRQKGEGGGGGKGGVRLFI